MQLNVAMGLALVLIVTITILVALFTKVFLIIVGIAAAGCAIYAFVIPNISPFLAYINRATLHLNICRPDKPVHKIIYTCSKTSISDIREELAKTFGVSGDSLPKITIDGYELSENVPVSYIHKSGNILTVTFDK